MQGWRWLCHPVPPSGMGRAPHIPKRVHVSCASSHSMQGIPCCVCPISFTGVNWDLSVLLGWNTALVVVTKSWGTNEWGHSCPHCDLCSGAGDGRGSLLGEPRLLLCFVSNSIFLLGTLRRGTWADVKVAGWDAQALL